MAEPVDDLTYGDGYFNFTFKDGTILKLTSDGSFEHVTGGSGNECVATAQHQPPPVIVRPSLGDSEEVHILTLCLGAVAGARVVMRGLLALRQERNRSIEARQSTREAFSKSEEPRQIT